MASEQVNRIVEAEKKAAGFEHEARVKADEILANAQKQAQKEYQDALSAARPGARRETLDVYIKRLEKLEEIANTTPGVDKSYAIQAGREIRIIAKPEEVKDDEIALLARDISKRIESELEYPGQIKVNVVRETRAVDYAK